MIIERAFAAYNPECLDAVNAVANQRRDLYQRKQEKSKSAVALLYPDIRNITKTWQVALRQIGNGDESIELTQGVWLNHQQQYIDKVTLNYGKELSKLQFEVLKTFITTSRRLSF